VVTDPLLLANGLVLWMNSELGEQNSGVNSAR
jgi:hypothetical protein